MKFELRSWKLVTVLSGSVSGQAKNGLGGPFCRTQCPAKCPDRVKTPSKSGFTGPFLVVAPAGLSPLSKVRQMGVALRAAKRRWSATFAERKATLTCRRKLIQTQRGRVGSRKFNLQTSLIERNARENRAQMKRKRVENEAQMKRKLNHLFMQGSTRNILGPASFALF